MTIYVGKNRQHTRPSHFPVITYTSYKEWQYMWDWTNIWRFDMQCSITSIIFMLIQEHKYEKWYIELFSCEIPYILNIVLEVHMIDTKNK